MRTIFISGADKGLGRALGEIFLTAGDFVIGTSITGSSTYSHENLVMLPLDLCSPESIDNCIREVQNLNRQVNVLINNAGVLKDRNETRVALENLRVTLEVNLFGHVQITESLLPLVSHGGHIINISSSAGSLENTSQASYPSYKISKAALNMYTRTLAIRLSGQITVSAVHPGWIKTDMGGNDADITPQEAAQDIFKLATSEVESGQFWFGGKKFPW